MPTVCERECHLPWLIGREFVYHYSNHSSGVQHCVQSQSCVHGTCHALTIGVVEVLMVELCHSSLAGTQISSSILQTRSPIWTRPAVAARGLSHLWGQERQRNIRDLTKLWKDWVSLMSLGCSESISSWVRSYRHPHSEKVMMSVCLNCSVGKISKNR